MRKPLPTILDKLREAIPNQTDQKMVLLLKEAIEEINSLNLNLAMARRQARGIRGLPQ